MSHSVAELEKGSRRKSFGWRFKSARQAGA